MHSEKKDPLCTEAGICIEIHSGCIHYYKDAFSSADP